MLQLATRFSRNTNVLRSASPLGEEQMRLAAPSIFAAGKHVSRSDAMPISRASLRKVSCFSPRSSTAPSAASYSGRSPSPNLK